MIISFYHGFYRSYIKFFAFLSIFGYNAGERERQMGIYENQKRT